MRAAAISFSKLVRKGAIFLSREVALAGAIIRAYEDLHAVRTT